MSTQDNSIQQDPEITLDTEVQFDVSDSTDLNPQTVEYSQAKDDVQSLEAYQALLKTAREGISAQTQAVLNTHLAQIDTRLGRATQYGLEAFTIDRRSKIHKGTITLEAIQERLTQARGQLYRFNTHEVLMMAFEEVAEASDGESRMQKFIAWLTKIYEWLKDKLSGGKAKREALEKKIEAVAAGLVDTYSVTEFDGQPLDTGDIGLGDAMVDGQLNTDVDHEVQLAKKLADEWYAWVVHVLNDSRDLLKKTAESEKVSVQVFEAHLNAVWSKWGETAPEDFACGGNHTLTINRKTLELSLNEGGEATVPEQKIRPAAERQKQADHIENTSDWAKPCDDGDKAVMDAWAELSKSVKTSARSPEDATVLYECWSMLRPVNPASLIKQVGRALSTLERSREAKINLLELESRAIRKLARAG